jgi:hypothetical protein
MLTTNQVAVKKLQAELLDKGYKYLRLCDEESTNPVVKHYTIEKSSDVDSRYCIDNSLIELEDEKAIEILDCFLNPIVIHPNPLEV